MRSWAIVYVKLKRLQLIVGDKEVEGRSVNIRRYGQTNQHSVSIQAFVELALEEIENKKYRLQ